MEYYDEIRELLDKIIDLENPHDEENEKLINLFKNESGKEIYLIFSEWISGKGVIDFDSFYRVIPLIIILLERLKNSSPLISQELIDTIYAITSFYSNEQKHLIEEFICSNKLENVPAFDILMSLFITTFTKELADKILPVFYGEEPIESDITQTIAKNFSSFPASYKAAFARCALIYPQKFKLLSLQRMAETLIGGNNPNLQSDGIKILSFVNSPSSPRDLFVTLVKTGPYLSTAESAQNAWKQALSILEKLNDNDRFYSYQAALESNDLPEASHSAICHQLQREIYKANGGIFRSPMIQTILPLILEPSILTSPVGKVESTSTILNFLLFLLMSDHKYHCFRIFGTKDIIDNIEKCVRKVQTMIDRSKKDNERPDDVILKESKKVNLTENLTINDIAKIKESTSLSISRIEFILDEINTILK